MTTNYTTQNTLILGNLLEYYKKDNNLERILPIINGESKISLRLIDWFVTNYCKKNTILTNIINKKTNNNEIINIYQSYKSNLKAFSKQYFDPFRRNKKIFFVFNINSNNFSIIKNIDILNNTEINNTEINNNIKKENIIETTIGQLNFFKWIIENNIYEYICIHKKIIENDMILIQKENIKKKNDKNNLIYKNIKNSDGSIKIVTRKKRVELSKSKLNNISLIQEKRIVYF